MDEEFPKIPENSRISTIQEAAIQLLLEGSKYSEVAKKCKIDEKTLYLWRKDPVFQEALSKGHKHLLESSFVYLQSKFNKAVDTLDKHLDAKNTIPRDQIKAAEAVVDRTIQTIKLTERITELEAELAAFKQTQSEDQEFFITFDLRKTTKEQRDILRLIIADIAAREVPHN
jgi:hypothetical protein